MLADERRIMQVVDNLLTNAVRYSPAATPISLRARAVNGHVEVEVEDQGSGIPVDKKDVVFDKFVRLDGEANRAGGSGLGLAICRGIVQAHNGRIWVKSEPGVGSRFAFSLPRGREAV